jgi:hypothetical protein
MDTHRKERRRGNSVKWRTALPLTVNLYLKDEVFVSLALQVRFRTHQKYLLSVSPGVKMVGTWHLPVTPVQYSTWEYIRYLIHCHSILNFLRNPDASVGIVKELVFDSRQGQDIPLFSVTCRPAVGPTQLPMQSITGALSPGVKRQLRDADHCLSIGEIKNGEALPPFPQTSSWHGV